MPLELKEVFEVESMNEAFYTGGNVEWTRDGTRFLCMCGTSVKILSVDEGKEVGHVGVVESDLEGGQDEITSFVLSYDNNFLVTSHRCSLFKLWSWRDNTLEKQWKVIHRGPVMSLALTKDGDILASGGSDSSIRLWNLKKNSCTHNLTGLQGVVRLLKFLETGDKQFIFGSGDDLSINCYDLPAGNLCYRLTGHYSKVTSLAFSPSGDYLASCGRDKVMILWDLKEGVQKKVIPTFECLESVVTLPSDYSPHETDYKSINPSPFIVATAGEKGVIKVWDLLSVKLIYTQSNSVVESANEEGNLNIYSLLYNEEKSAYAIVTADQNIILHDLQSFKCQKQIVGFSDEILDVSLIGENDSHLVVVTNSKDIKVYSVKDMDCRLLKGHTDLVICLASTVAERNIFASAAKDNSVRLWMLSSDGSVSCIASGMLHSGSVGSIAFSQLSPTFLLSGSEDTILKMWTLPKTFLKCENPCPLVMKLSVLAHEKDINGIAVSPNDKLIATASLDKTAKLWSSSDLSLVGVLKGHKRSVWSCCFSPVDQVLLTTSADATLKFWSVIDLTCIKSLEGHDSSVLRGVFVTRGLQVLSCGGDGLLKVWSLKTGESNTFDAHMGKVWALAVFSNEERVVTGGSDSRLIIWKDKTEEKKLEKAALEHSKILKEQELSNLIQADQLLPALKLALSLERPATTFKIFQGIVEKGKEDGLGDLLKGLDSIEKILLLKCAAHWNTNSKNSYVAQLISSVLLPEVISGDLKVPVDTIEALLPFTERHFKRLTQAMEDIKLLDYTKALLKPTSLCHVDIS